MNQTADAIRSSFNRQPIFWSLFIISAVLFLFYSNSFNADWHYDDFHHIKENINIRKFSNIPNLFKDPTTFSRNPKTRTTRPLLMTTHALNYQLGLLTTRNGYNVVGYHIVNFAFHLISAILMFFITLYIFRNKIIIEELDPLVPALFAGLLFGLHTINTESVVYISSRSAAMATMFIFLAFYLYMKAALPEKISYSGILLSVLGFTAGLLTKEIAITLPALLLIYEVTLNRPWFERSARTAVYIRTTISRLLPYGITAFLFLYYRHLVLNENILKRFSGKGGTQAAPDMVSQLATQIRVWVYYLRQMLWPTGLSIDKPFKVSRSFGDPHVLMSLLVIAVIIIIALKLWKKYPLITFGAGWYFTALLPESLIRLNVVLNDHRLYLSSLGWVLIMTFVSAKLFIRFRQDGGLYYKGFVAICLSILLFMGLGTFKRNMAFATEETIWKDVILKDKQSVRGYNNLGIYYEQRNEWDKALAHYQQTIKLAPMFPNPYINIGNVYHKKKEYEKAEKWMKRALQLDPRSALASYNLGNILREAGKTDVAISAYKKALQLNPRYIEAANNLANIYFKKRSFNEAIEYYKKALFIDPTFAMSYYNIALANENLGQFQEAMANYQQFLRYWLGDSKYRALAQRKIDNLSKNIGD